MMASVLFLLVLLLSLFSTINATTTTATTTTITTRLSPLSQTAAATTTGSIRALLQWQRLNSLNGGERKTKSIINNNKLKTTTATTIKNKSSARKLLDSVQETLQQIKPITRYYLLLSLFCTLVHAAGLPAPALFAHDLSRPWQLWRWFTSVAYFGPPSLMVANHLYFLVRYGQAVETTKGRAEFAWFLLLQTLLLGILGLTLGFPLLAQSLTTAIVYASCRINPMETIPFQFGLMVKSWQIPYASLALDCLAQQTIAAAWPHVLGIFTAHLYEFCTEIWPRLGGSQLLAPPAWFVNRLGGPKRSNIEGMDFRTKTTTGTAASQRQRKKKQKFATLFTSK